MVYSNQDRCDKCSAQTQERFIKAGASLDFCSHHSHEYRQHLIALGFTPERMPQPVGV